MTAALAQMDADARHADTRAVRRSWWFVAGIVVALVLVVLAVARWTGQAPFGSDNDEYRLVARQLLHLDAPVVAGVEGTKYPLGYPALLAVMDAVGLPAVNAALVLNVGLAGAAAACAGVAVRHRGAAAAIAAAGVVLVARPLWDATQSTMPDVAFTAVVIAAVLALGARRSLLWLTALVVVATSLKSVGVVLGVAATAALLWQIRTAQRAVRAKERLAALLPASAGLATATTTALIVGRYPEHTTGYARTFWLDDPYDAAGGDASVLDVLARIPKRLDLVLDDAARALWGELVHGAPAWTLTLGLVAAGIAGARTATTRVLLGTFVVLDLVALAMWPYSSVRFGLPLVPIAAMGAGTIVSRIRVPERAAIAATTAAIAVLVVLAVPAFRREAHREGVLYAELDAARRDVAAWLPPDARPVSADYRELATALPRDRSVLPLEYTSHPDALLAEAEQGTHLVVLRGLYGSREAVVAALLEVHGDRFELVHQNPHADVYVIGQ